MLVIYQNQIQLRGRFIQKRRSRRLSEEGDVCFVPVATTNIITANNVIIVDVLNVIKPIGVALKMKH